MDEDLMEHAERLSALEVRAGRHDTDMTELKDEFRKVIESINGMKEELSKYRGFWGGIIIVCSALWAFLTLAWESIWARLKGES